MAKIGSLIAQLGMNTANYEAGVKRARSMTRQFSRDAKRQFNRINNSVGTLGAGIAALAGAGSLTYMIKDAIDAADEIEKLNRRIGISTEALSELKFAGEQSGIQFQTLTKSMEKMSNSIAEATDGIGEGKEAFKELGIDVQELKKLKPEDQLLVLAEAFKQVENTSERTQLAMDIFGQRGASMLQLMENGAGDIQTLRKEARQLGLTLTEDAAKGAADANDALNRARSVMKATALEIATNMAPGIESLANNFSQTIPGGVNFAVDAFYDLRKAGLQVLTVLTDRYATFSYMVGEILEKVGMQGEADKAFSNATFLANWSQRMSETAESTRAAQEALQAFRNEVKDIPVEPTEDVAEALANAGRNGRDTQDEVKALAESIKVDIGDTSRDVFQQVQDQFKGMVLSMINSWISSGIQDLFSSGGGFLASLFNIPGKASGGPVQSSKPYIVGEKGPELFVPGASGSIVPNHALGAGGTTVVMNNEYNVYGASDAEIIQKINQANQATKREIQNMMVRGRF